MHPALLKKEGLDMRLLEGVGVETLAKFTSKECKNGFSTTYLLIIPLQFCMHRYRVNNLHQRSLKQWSGYDLLVGVLQL